MSKNQALRRVVIIDGNILVTVDWGADYRAENPGVEKSWEWRSIIIIIFFNFGSLKSSVGKLESQFWRRKPDKVKRVWIRFLEDPREERVRMGMDNETGFRVEFLWSL